MAESRPVPLQKLQLDLANYRTTKQSSEEDAVAAMVSTSPDRFWALMESLLEDGYLPTESILVLRSGRGGQTLTVREGNRRVAALKLVHGLLTPDAIEIPLAIRDRIATLPDDWFDATEDVPCTLYPPSDKAKVDRIVRLAHGKGEKAGRDQWNAVARARHNRDANGASEPALDLLEKYLSTGKDLTDEQATRWAGDYPLTVLTEAMKRLAPRMGLTSSTELAAKYPKVKFRKELDTLLRDIGIELVGFPQLRNKDTDFGVDYGFPPAPSSPSGDAKSGSSSQKGSSRSGGGSGGSSATTQTRGRNKAASGTDPRSVKRLLRQFGPRGAHREKVVALKDEAIKLDVTRTPLAFCFVLRSMFEISAKAYAADHGISTTQKNGQDRTLLDLLRACVADLTNNSADKAAVRALHGSLVELGKPEGILSVTSMNQLVHNPRFSVSPADLSTLFGNVYPLLHALNS